MPVKRLIHFLKNVGITDSLDEEEAKIVLFHNILALISIVLVLPFPFVFIWLNIYEGLYLCLVAGVLLFLAFFLNYIQAYVLSRLMKIFLAYNMFFLGVLFFGYNAGFLYGMMVSLVTPIMYVKYWRNRLIIYSLLIFESLLVLFFFNDAIPLFYEPENQYILNGILFLLTSLLLVSYFLCLDWINELFEEKNKILVEKITQRNEELKNFSYSTSHDLKQPLRTILNFIHLFTTRKQKNLDEEGLTFLNFVKDAAERLNSLIDALLQHSILGQSGEFEMVDCNLLVGEVIRDLNMMVQEHEAELRVGHLPVIMANRQEIGTVFQNLISNAIKFKKTNSIPRIEIEAKPNNQFWQFSVKDNGVGIDLGSQEKIFQIFQRGHVSKDIPGTGIGLANCKKIIKLHSGDIWVDSSPGEGAAFYFTIKR